MSKTKKKTPRKVRNEELGEAFRQLRNRNLTRPGKNGYVRKPKHGGWEE